MFEKSLKELNDFASFHFAFSLLQTTNFSYLFNQCFWWHDGIVPKRNKSEKVLSVKGLSPKILPQSGITPKSNNSERLQALE